MKVYLVRFKFSVILNFILTTLNVELAVFVLIDIKVYFIQFSKIMFLLIFYVRKVR